MAGLYASGWAAIPRRHPVWTALILLLIALCLFLALGNWNWARGPVERVVSGMTGREFRIDGPLDVDFFPLEVDAGGLYLGSARWSSRPAMATADHLHARVRFWPLLIGRFKLPLLELQKPALSLERNAQGVGNWQFRAVAPECAKGGCESRLRIQQLLARGGRLRFDEAALETAIDLRFDSGKPARQGALAPLRVSGTGKYRSAPFELEGHVDSPLALQDEALPYQLDVVARAGDSRARLHGALREPLQIQNVTIGFELSGADLADLYEFTGIVLPGTPPYQLEGRLSRNGNRYSYEAFSGTVGDSDLAGDAHFEIGGPRPRLTAKLHSRVIDFDDLAGFIGGTAATAEGESASEEQKAQASAQRASGRRLPDTPIRTGRLRAMDADVELDAARVNSPRLPLESMHAHLQLDDGVLSVKPLDFGAAGGRLATEVQLDARHEPARFLVDMRLQELQLPLLMPRVKQLRDSLGSLGGRLVLEGTGNSAASVLAGSDGEFSVYMGSGRISNLLLEMAGLDIAESLSFLLGKDRQVTLRCAYADFGIAGGIATARSVAIDTTDTALLVRGDVSFRDETLDLLLLQRPKDPSPVSIRTPVRITGTFMDPDIALKGGPLILRGAAVAALAVIAPPLAVLGLIEPGPGKDSLCAGDAGDSGEQRQPRDAPEPSEVGPRPAPDFGEEDVKDTPQQR